MEVKSAMHIRKKRQIFLIFKGKIEREIKKYRKLGKAINIQFTKIKVDLKYMKRCLTSLMLREIKINTRPSNYLSCSRLSKIEELDHTVHYEAVRKH